MTESKIEWAYAFDLHCNGFFAIYIWLYVLQLFLLPLIIGPKWISLFLGNSLYLAAYGFISPPHRTVDHLPRFLQYFYVVYLGLSGTFISVLRTTLTTDSLALSPAYQSLPLAVITHCLHLHIIIGWL